LALLVERATHSEAAVIALLWIPGVVLFALGWWVGKTVTMWSAKFRASLAAETADQAITAAMRRVGLRSRKDAERWST
jgi:hypothetical protein